MKDIIAFDERGNYDPPHPAPPGVWDTADRPLTDIRTMAASGENAGALYEAAGRVFKIPSAKTLRGLLEERRETVEEFYEYWKDDPAFRGPVLWYRGRRVWIETESGNRLVTVRFGSDGQPVTAAINYGASYTAATLVAEALPYWAVPRIAVRTLGGEAMRLSRWVEVVGGFKWVS